MTPVDSDIHAVVLLSAIYGAVRGFLREAISLASWVIALWLAWHYAELLTPYFSAIESVAVRAWTARGIILIGALVVGTFVGILASRVVRLSLFSGLDRFLGFLFGAVRGVVILGLVVILADQLRIDTEQWWRKSQLIPYAEMVASGIRSLVGEGA